jgi:hypothetical protein
MILGMEIPMDAIVCLWAFCPCNVTGKQSLSLDEEFRKRGIRVDVYSADLQETLMESRKHRHHVGDYKEAYEILLNAYGNPPWSSSVTRCATTAPLCVRETISRWAS